MEVDKIIPPPPTLQSQMKDLCCGFSKYFRLPKRFFTIICLTFLTAGGLYDVLITNSFIEAIIISPSLSPPHLRTPGREQLQGFFLKKNIFFSFLKLSEGMIDTLLVLLSAQVRDVLIPVLDKKCQIWPGETCWCLNCAARGSLVNCPNIRGSLGVGISSTQQQLSHFGKKHYSKYSNFDDETE